MMLRSLFVSAFFSVQLFAAPYALEPIVSKDLVAPVAVVVAPGEPGRLYIVEQPGRIRVFEKGALRKKPFLDITARVSWGGEMGLLGLAFHPDYAANHRYFVNYTKEKPSRMSVNAEYHAGSDAEKVLLTYDQPYANHNGGGLAFGPDRMLYIATGDGGFRADPHGNGQNKATLLGKILRLDVDHGSPYTVPGDNPFVSEKGARGEIFAYGLRNPFRFSFDPANGLLYTGDVGQDKYEEIDLITKGGNYGWNVMEGNHCFKPAEGCKQAGLTLPLFEYPHAGSDNCITGGYVYRGKRIPGLAGAYVYADYGSGKIWALRLDASGRKAVSNDLLLASDVAVSSFGVDAGGEILVVGLAGTVSRLVDKAAKK